MRSRSNGGVIGAYALPTKNSANGVFFIHDAAIYNTGSNPIWPINSGYLPSITGTNYTVTTDPNDSNYNLVTFTTNGTFSILTGSGSVEMLVVGGGGAGGSSSTSTSGVVGGGAGGGGGGVVITSAWLQSGTTLSIQVGTGGASSATVVNDGTVSRVYSTSGTSIDIYAAGGGGGSNYYGYAGHQGGSGGGYNSATGVYNTTAASIQSAYGYGYGNHGGAAINNGGGYSAGGGGGAGSAGGAGVPVRGPSANGLRNGDGGQGILWNRTGIYYGSGGAGAFISDGAYTSPIPVIYSGYVYGPANQTYYTTTAGSGTQPARTVGGGGSGGSAYYISSGSRAAESGTAGANGTVILRYRYK